ncbi:glycosyltransferase family 4 protein [Algibacter amylolyticus]|uniref:Glycosyltransferase family 4 protein n=1 Tax=Algibacter amylolyticus TaxID=1608400 RepID=A0A5M7B855_9FLAO|nr:glycosyltransferase family 4 protein [Algibacter amylolyticus]KAA5825592.1 glycosyltransferase family 4 protein [Algibacter amylolyticus]MBB5268182.1 glycosyltransferase involved in cell wall biosynthesis [Algibacter amylolyticus]TSJ79890.1 glycosyltransferase family 4 protein [Algibacter amylolyticus]
MNIIYYTDQVYLHGGLERVLANKLNYFSKNTNFKLHVITFQQLNKAPCYKINDKVTFHDLGIHYNRDISFLHPSNIKLAPKHYSRLKAKINEIKPDVIVVCNYEFGFYFIPLIAKKSINIKEYHSSGHFNYKARLENKNVVKKYIYKISDYFETKYDYLVLLTSDEQKYYKSNNTVIIPNAIQETTLKTAKLTNKKVISAGRIAPVKGFEYLIFAWEIVVKDCPEWTLNIFGDGDPKYVAQLKKQIKTLNLENNIFLKGATKTLESEMLDSSIYVMSSLTECFPMVLLEAMGCGLPILSFDCPNGPRHIIKHNEDGILVEYLNIKQLAKNLIELMKDPTKLKSLGYHAKNNMGRLTEEKIMPQWLKLFKKETLN